MGIVKKPIRGENSKHGIWFDDVPEALSVIQQYNLTLVGFHMHIGSGVDYQHLASVCDAMVEQVLTSKVDINAISAGGDYQRHIKKVMQQSI